MLSVLPLYWTTYALNLQEKKSIIKTFMSNFKNTISEVFNLLKDFFNNNNKLYVIRWKNIG